MRGVKSHVGREEKEGETGWKRGKDNYISLLCRSNESLILNNNVAFQRYS